MADIDFKGMNVSLSGAADLERVLKKLPEKIGDKVLSGAIMAGAEVIRKEAAARAPVRSGGGIKKIAGKTGKGRLPGFLKASIIKKRKRKVAGAVDVGPSKDAFYGMYSEFSTRNQPARPFMAPAFEAKKTEALAKIGKKLGVSIEKAAARLAGSFAKSGLKSRRRR